MTTLGKLCIGKRLWNGCRGSSMSLKQVQGVPSRISPVVCMAGQQLRPQLVIWRYDLSLISIVNSIFTPSKVWINSSHLASTLDHPKGRRCFKAELSCFGSMCLLCWLRYISSCFMAPYRFQSSYLYSRCFSYTVTTSIQSTLWPLHSFRLSYSSTTELYDYRPHPSAVMHYLSPALHLIHHFRPQDHCRPGVGESIAHIGGEGRAP